jgi:hypothetical protein
VDNSGLHHAFYSDLGAASSFLQLVRQENLRVSDLDPEAIVEFLHFGCIYSGKTLFPQIRKIGPTVILRVPALGRVQLLPKPVRDIGEAPEHSLEGLLQSFIASVATEKVSLDLTGGIDSRLLAVILSYFGMPFELAASGINGNCDLVIAEQVASVLGREFHVTQHNPESTDWEQRFHICDGLFDLAKSDRPLQLQEERAARGVTLAMSGAGGEMFKDFWWLQDFPFYASSKPRLKRLYELRLAAIEPRHSYLAPPYRAISEHYRQRLLCTLSEYTVRGNTQTYDRIYYDFKMREFAGRFLTNSLYFLDACAPYLDRDVVTVGYGLPRVQRFFNGFHRRLLTRLNREAACIPTSEGGMSASSKAADVSADLLKYVTNRAQRIAKKASQKFLGKTFSRESVDHPALHRSLHQLAATRRSLERLKDHGILNSSLQLGEIESGYLGTILALDMMLQKLEVRSHQEIQKPLAA